MDKLVFPKIDKNILKMDITKNIENKIKKTSNDSIKLEDTQKLFEESRVSKYHKIFHKNIRKSKISLIKAALKYIFSSENNSKTHYTYFGRTKFKVLTNYLSDLLRVRYRKNWIDKNLEYSIKPNVPFIYFPLHLDEEMSLLIQAPFYTNQLEIIKNIEKISKKKIKFKIASPRIGDTEVSITDTSLAGNELEWIPSYNINDICKHSIKFWKIL